MRTLQYLVASLLLTSACASAPPVATAPSNPCNLAAAPPRVQLFGGIKHPGALAYEPGLTVYGAIARAGGLASSAVARQVRIVRCGRALAPLAVPEAPGVLSDLPLQRGDVLDIPAELS